MPSGTLDVGSNVSCQTFPTAWRAVSPANIWWNKLHGNLTRMRKIYKEETLYPRCCLVPGPGDGHEHTTIYLVLLDSQYELVVYHNISKSTLFNYCHHLMILWSTWYTVEYCIPKGIPPKNNSHSVNVNLVLSFDIWHTCGELSHDFWTPWGFAPSPW